MNRLARALAILFVSGIAASAGCRRSPPPEPSASTTPSGNAPAGPLDEAPGQTELTSALPATPGEAGGITYIERVTAGAAADARLPLVVAIHGMGDRPESWISWWDGFPVAARVILPRAPTPYSHGFSWFRYPARSSDELADGIQRAGDGVATALAAIVRSRPTLGKPIVTGFSQGGVLSFALAARHPSEIAAAFPLSGGLPLSLIPEVRFDPGRAPPIVAVHGDADAVVPIAFARDATARLRALGFDVRLEEVPHVGHTVTPATRAEIARLIAATARTQR